MEDFEKSKAFLKQAGPNGQSLYDHLTDTILHIVKEKPQDALAAFEKLSVQVKASKLVAPVLKEVDAKDEKKDTKVDAKTAAASKAAETNSQKLLLAAIDRNVTLLKPPEPKEEDDDSDDKKPAAPVNPNNPNNVSAEPIKDLMADAELLEWAGVSIGKDEWFQLQLSIQELCDEKAGADMPLDSVRFWGKVSGTAKDYYVVEAKCAELKDKDGVDLKRVEALGTGANEYVYFASNSAAGRWTQLPAVTPEQIVLARAMRRFFTGDLTAPVLGFPRFPYGEASYLRAQIARISAATSVSPKGYYEADTAGPNDSEVLVEADAKEYDGLKAEDLYQVGESWVHHRKHLRAVGRCEPEPEDDDDAKDGAAADGKAKDEEPLKKLLEPIAADEVACFADATKGLPWTFRVNPAVGKNFATNPRAAVSVHSLSWPGAVTVARKRHFVNIYIGNGQKYLGAAYTPPAPPAVQQEFVAVFNPDDGEEDPMIEQTDPLPDKNAVIPDDAKEGADQRADSGDDEDPNAGADKDDGDGDADD